MKKKIFTALLLILTFTLSKVNGQSEISRPSYLTIDAAEDVRSNILNSLDTLFAQIDNEKLDTNLIYKDNYPLTIALLNSLKGTEHNKKDSINNFYKKQIINLYPISATDYFISIAYVGNKMGETPVLKTIFNLIAKNQNGKFAFTIPTSFLTNTWKSEKIDKVTYHFADNINVERAKIFAKKNSTIATKLGLSPEKFDFYLCNNYQDAVRLLGY